MHIKSFTLLALSAVGAVAHVEEKRQIVPTDSQGFSVLSVLATAIPQSLVSLALTNPGALSSELASSLSAGKTPDWYSALPSDVKSYLPKLYPATAAATTTASATASATDSASASISASISSVQASISASISSALNTTTISSVNSPTLASTRGANSAASSSSSTGGASYPTAVVGAGFAGAIGFLGMLAL